MNNRAVRWGSYVLVAIAFAIACAYLSHWQFSRNEERSGQIALVEQNYDAAPITLVDALDADGALIPDQEWHPVMLHGRYLADQQLLVRNRPHAGTSAFEVLVPLRTDDGELFIVDRGWVEAGNSDAPEAIAAPPSGDVDVVVRLRPTEAQPRSGRGAPEGQVPTIHVPGIAEHLVDIGVPDAENTVTSAYGQLVSEDPAADALGAFDRPTDDPGPHLSYAVQWILFAVMGFIFIGYIIRTEIQKHREQAEGREPAPRRRRRDRDADAEDELLDAVL